MQVFKLFHKGFCASCSIFRAVSSFICRVRSLGASGITWVEGWGEALGDPGQYSQDFRLQVAWLIKRAEETFCFTQTHFLHKELGGEGGEEPSNACTLGRPSLTQGADSETAAACPGSWHSQRSIKTCHSGLLSPP